MVCQLPIPEVLRQDKDIINTSATTMALMERFETVDDLASTDLEN